MPKITQHKTPQSICRTCNYTLDAATCTDGRSAPSPEDLSICISCATVSKYGENLDLIPLSVEELNDICENSPETWEELSKAVNFVKSLKEAKDDKQQ